LKNHLRGTGITTAHINRIVESYKDAHLIYADLENEKSKLHQILSGGGLLNRFKETFYKYMVSFLTYRVSDICTLEYQGVELKRLSLGQRASAMILFLLAVDGFAQFIIDQPEDDLDNQSIYHDVVKELIRLKYKCQFLFATHNPNIPVLGDCEQVFSCNHKNGHIISPRSGGIDSQEIRKEIISVMEGGEDAFRRRNEIYSLWQN
jgi:chromosome segregation protein